MRQIDVDDRGTTGISRAFRTLFMIGIFAYVVMPFLDDTVALASIMSAGNTDNLGDALRTSLALHRAQVLFHIIGCGVGVGLLLYQAQHEDSRTFVLAPLAMAVSVGVVGVIGNVFPVPELDALQKTILQGLAEKPENKPLLDMAYNFGVLGIKEYLAITSVFIGLTGMGTYIQGKHKAEDDAADAEKGKRPEGWGKNDE